VTPLWGLCCCHRCCHRLALLLLLLMMMMMEVVWTPYRHTTTLTSVEKQTVMNLGITSEKK
jgi:hypothetical protein